MNKNALWQLVNFQFRIMFGFSALGYAMSAFLLTVAVKRPEAETAANMMSMFKYCIAITGALDALKALMALCDCDANPLQGNKDKKEAVEAVSPAVHIDYSDALCCNLDALHALASFLPIASPVFSLLRLLFDQKNAGKIIAKHTKNAYLAIFSDGCDLKTRRGIDKAIEYFKFMQSCFSFKKYICMIVCFVGLCITIASPSSQAKKSGANAFLYGFAFMGWSLVTQRICNYYIYRLSIFKPEQTIEVPTQADGFVHEVKEEIEKEIKDKVKEEIKIVAHENPMFGVDNRIPGL